MILISERKRCDKLQRRSEFSMNKLEHISKSDYWRRLNIEQTFHTKKILCWNEYWKRTQLRKWKRCLITSSWKTSGVEWFLDIKIDWQYRRTKATCVKKWCVQKEKSWYYTLSVWNNVQNTWSFFLFENTINIYWSRSCCKREYWFAIYSKRKKQVQKYICFFERLLFEQIVFQLNWIDAKYRSQKNISDWQLLIIDCIEKVVTLAWTSIDYSWSFPYLDHWSNVFDKNQLNVCLWHINFISKKLFNDK